MRSNHEYSYFGNVIEYEYDYLVFKTNVIEYNKSDSTITEYDYTISVTCAKPGHLASLT